MRYDVILDMGDTSRDSERHSADKEGKNRSKRFGCEITVSK